MKEKLRLYFWLLSVHLWVSAFTFGGGYVVVPMLGKFYVEKKKLFSQEKLLNLAAIAQSSPGAIAINLSALTGYEAAGLAGVLISTVSAILPPLLILTAVSHWYLAFSSNMVIAAVLKGMAAGAAAVMVDFIIDMVGTIQKERSPFLMILIPAAFFSSYFLHVNAALILFICCTLCVLSVWRKQKAGEAI